MKYLTILVVALSMLITACGEQKTAEELLAEAENAAERQDFQPALLNLNVVLQEDGNNARARWLKGKIVLQFGYAADAVKELDRARALGMSDDSVLPFLARAHVELRNFDSVIAIPVDNLGDENRADLLASKVIAAAHQNKLDIARDYLDQALTAGLSSNYLNYAAVVYYVAAGDRKAARQVLEQLLQVDPPYADAWALQGDLLLGEQRLEEAESAFGKSIDNDLANFPTKLRRALARIYLGKFDEAKADLNELRRINASYAPLEFAWGLLHFFQQDYPKAQEHFELTLARDANHVPSHFFLANTYLNVERDESAASHARRVVFLAPDYVPGRELLAKIQLLEQRYSDAKATIVPVVRDDPSRVDAVQMLAAALEGLGDTKASVSLLQELAETKPELADLQRRVGLGLLADGRFDEGIDYLGRAKQKSEADSKTRVALVLALLRANETEEAYRAAVDYVEQFPGDSNALNLRGLAELANANSGDAERTFRGVLDIDPADAVALQNLASIYYQNGDRTSARKLTEQLLQQDPTHLQALLRLARLAAEDGKHVEMEALLEKAVDAHPAELQPRVLLARLQLKMAGRAQDALNTVRPLMDMPIRETEVLRIQALSLLMLGRYQEAKRVIPDWQRMSKDDAELHYVAAQISSFEGKLMDSLASLKKAVSLNPNFLEAKTALIGLYGLTGNYALAEPIVASLEEQFANNAAVMRALSEYYSGRGNHSVGVDWARRLHEIRPSGEAGLLLVRALVANGNWEEAIKFQQKRVVSEKRNPRTLFELAEVYIATGDIEKGVDELRNVLGIDENYLPALNNLAWLLKDKEPVAALSYAESAYRLAPDDDNIADTYATVLRGTGDTKKAEQVVATAREAYPDSLELKYHHALILSDMGGRQAALVLLDELLADKKFNQRSDALKLKASLEYGTR